MKAFFQNSEVWPVLLALGSCPLQRSCGYSLLSDRLMFIHCLPKLGNFIILLFRDCKKVEVSTLPLSLRHGWERNCHFVYRLQVVVHNNVRTDLCCDYPWYILWICCFVLRIYTINLLFLNMGVNLKKATPIKRYAISSKQICTSSWLYCSRPLLKRTCLTFFCPTSFIQDWRLCCPPLS